ncbi:MAG: hypothetical protein WAV50_01140 [Minisyncoccia bacterium]
MKEDFLSYFITLIILAAAAAAAWLIIHLASPNTAASIRGEEANYAPLQQSILK